jgi:biotin carboxyl carrier protein
MAQEILAPLAGKIVKIEIQQGVKIDEDDEAFIIEAMKMETPIYAPFSGTVKEIAIKEGDKVEEGQLLAIIE